MSYKFLYRALRQEEIENQCNPLSKIQKPFKDNPLLGTGDARFPINLGETEEYAVRHHQNGFPTKGISTTPHLEIAKKYSRAGVIIKINFSNLEEHGIKAYIVKDWLKFPEDIIKPEDDEIILVMQDSTVFPKDLIQEVIKIPSY